MRRLQIGMWNGFDEEYWNKYSNKWITGIEISQYKNRAELNRLADFCQQKDLTIGIHTPVINDVESGYSLPKLPAYGEIDITMKRITTEVEIASEYQADYILFHYPFPPIYPTVKDPRYWSGPPEHDYFESNQVNPFELKEHSKVVLEKLLELQAKYDQKIVLEYDFFGDFQEIFIEMFKTYKELSLVIDTQRMEVHKRAFPGFDPYKWLNEVAPFVYLAHYSNTHYENGQVKRHLPVLPQHEADPNFGDSFTYLKYLNYRNENFHITFEHNPTLVTHEQLGSCFDQVYGLLGK